MSTPYASEAFLHQILGKALSAQACDVHLKVGQPPGARVRGDMVYFRVDKLRPEDTDAVARIVLGAKVRLDELTDRVTVYQAGALGRFRAALYRQRGALALVMRRIPSAVPTLAELGLPPDVATLAEAGQGLVVVAGGAGQGKSSTLAAMVGHLNASRARHVITIEDPIEFVHEDSRSSISQRQVGVDTPSFSAGLRAALLQDVDAVLVSAIDGPATLDAALEVASAGRLVLAALPALDVPRAVSALFAIARAPFAGPRALTVERVVEGLHAIVAQHLAPTADGGATAAAAILVATQSARDALLRPDAGNALEAWVTRPSAPPAADTPPG